MMQAQQNEFTMDLTPGTVKVAMAGCRSSDLWKVPREQIKVMDGFNVRIKNDEYHAQVRLIADSMKANGYFPDKPLAGYVAREDGKSVIYLTDGHTRLDAVDLANSEGSEIREIPVVTKPAGTSLEDLTIALVVSNNGRNLSPFETATVCKRLIGYGMDEATIAKRIGMTRAYVANLLLLVAAPRAITNMVEQGQVSASLAVETLKTHGKEATKTLSTGLAQAKSEGKAKLTRKNLPSNTAIPTKAKVPTSEKKIQKELALESTPILKMGIKWLKEHDTHGESSRQLLAYLAGVDIESIDSLLDAAMSK